MISACISQTDFLILSERWIILCGVIALIILIITPTNRLRQVSGEANSFQYLAQRLSVAIQRGNSASVMGTMNGDDEEFFFV